MKKLLYLLLALAACAAPPAPEAPPQEPEAPIETWFPIPLPVDASLIPDFYAPTIADIATRLSERVPVTKNVVIMVCDLPGAWGMAMPSADDSEYLIWINYRCTEPDFLVDILTHEWAHCMAFDHPEMEQDDVHGDVWGIMSSRAYRAVLEGPVEPIGGDPQGEASPEVSRQMTGCSPGT